MTFVVQSLCRVRLFAAPGTAAHQASLSSISQSLLKLMSITSFSSSVIPFCCCLQSFPPSGSFPMSQLFASDGQSVGASTFNISPSNEYSGLIAFRIYWLDLLPVQGTLNSLLQHHSSKASILRCSAFFTVQLSHPYMTTGKTIAYKVLPSCLSISRNSSSHQTESFFQLKENSSFPC